MGGSAPERPGPDPRGSARGQGILSLPRRLRERLRRELVSGAGLVLILDYDGTLTPIVPGPEAARLAPSVRKILGQLAESPRVRLAILSGRSLSDVRGRVRLPRVVYGGCHGLEIAGAGVRFKHPGTRARTSLRAVTRVLARQLHGFPGAILELKGLSVSLHYRRVSRHRRGKLLRLAARVACGVPALSVLRGKRVLEFLPRVNWDKGRAARWIAKRLAMRLRPRPRVILYAGDDATDEAAFAALKGRGLTIRVGAERGGAEYAVRHVRAIHALLRRIARVIGSGGPGGRGNRGGGG